MCEYRYFILVTQKRHNSDTIFHTLIKLSLLTNLFARMNINKIEQIKKSLQF